MNGKHYVGKKAQTFEQYEDVKVDGIRIAASDGAQFTAGNLDGYVLDINCPYGTQQMADDLFSMLGGNVYRGYRATNAVLDPQAELGDGITINGIYSNLAYRRVAFGPSHVSEIAAPGESTLNHEYNYVSPTQREIDKLQGFAKNFTEYLELIKQQSDAKAETWYQGDDPSTGWDAEQKKEHSGDLWYNTSDSNFYIYNGEKWEKSPTAIPGYVFDEIDKKAQIFTSQPEPPYNEKDLWFGGVDEPIRVCVKTRAEGEAFNVDDWQKKDNYINEADAIISVQQQYYLSDSPTVLTGGSWSDSQPEWEQGKYIWNRQYVTYGDGTKKYLPSETGVCITGNTGATGAPGSPGANGTNGKDGTSSYTHIRYSENPDGSGFVEEPTASTKYIGIYTGTLQSAPATKEEYVWSKYMGDNGTNGTNGRDGNGIRSITYYYAATQTQAAPDAAKVTGTTIPTLSETNKYLWQKEVIDFTDDTVADKTTVILLAVYGDKGKDGTNGTNGTSVSITSTSIEYKADANGTTAPSSGWSKTIPPVSNGQYLWTKTIVTYSDGTSTTAYSVAYKGTNGTDGKDGTNGVGIKSITNYYLAHTSASGVTTDTAGWGTSVQSVTAAKPYLWNYEVTAYTDGSSTTVEPHIVGTYGRDGANGAAGKSISSITEHYLATSDAGGVTTNTPGWSATLQQTDTTKRYLWNYETITYTDGSSSTVAPRIIGTHGATGAAGAPGKDGAPGSNGEDGVGIESIEAEYIQSPSDVVPTEDPMARWGPDIPTPEKDMYIWTRQKITYTDGNIAYAGEYCMSKTVGDIVQQKLDAQTAMDILNKLTDNGRRKGIFMQDDELYISASAIITGILDAAKIVIAGVYGSILQGAGSTIVNGVTMPTNGLLATGPTRQDGSFSTLLLSDVGARLSYKNETGGTGVYVTNGYITTQNGALRVEDAIAMALAPETVYQEVLRMLGGDPMAVRLGNENLNVLIRGGKRVRIQADEIVLQGQVVQG